MSEIRKPQYLANLAATDVDPNWGWYWRCLVFACLAGGRGRHDLIGRDKGVLLGTNIWNGKMPEGPAAESNATATDGVYWRASRLLYRRLVRDCTIIVRADVDSMASSGSLLTVPYANSGFSSPFVSLGLTRSANTSSGRFLYTDAGSSEIVDSDVGFIATTDGPTTYGVTRKGATVKFFRNGIQHGVSKTLGADEDVDWNTENDVTIFNRSRYSTGNGIDGRCTLAAILCRSLTDEQMGLACAPDPFDPFREEPVEVGTAEAVVTENIYTRFNRQVVAEIF